MLAGYICEKYAQQHYGKMMDDVICHGDDAPMAMRRLPPREDIRPMRSSARPNNIIIPHLAWEEDMIRDYYLASYMMNSEMRLMRDRR